MQQRDEGKRGSARDERGQPAGPACQRPGEERGGEGKPPGNRMAEAMERGGILGWGSYLTFAWAGPFLRLGSKVTLKEENLEGIYKTYKRCVAPSYFVDASCVHV